MRGSSGSSSTCASLALVEPSQPSQLLLHLLQNVFWLFSAPLRSRVQKHGLATEVGGNKLSEQRWRKVKDIVAFLCQCQLESRHKCKED